MMSSAFLGGMAYASGAVKRGHRLAMTWSCDSAKEMKSPRTINEIMTIMVMILNLRQLFWLPVTDGGLLSLSELMILLIDSLY